MNDDPSLWKLKYEDLKNFEFYENYALTIPFVKESVEYLLIIKYKFQNYITEKLTKNTKPQIINLESLEKTEELEKYLDIPERIFLQKLRNLIQCQMSKINLHNNYPNVQIRNIQNYLLQEHPTKNVETAKERLIWMESIEKLKALIQALKENGFIERTQTEKILSVFCDKKGNTFNTLSKEMITWNKQKSELAYLMRLLIDAKYRMLADREIWVKVSKCIVDKDGNAIKPNSLAVSSQKGNPKSKELINSIVDKVKNLNTEGES
jgi:hypothetical protein